MELKVLMLTNFLVFRLKNGFLSLSRIYSVPMFDSGEEFSCYAFGGRKDDSIFEKLILPP